MLCASLITSLWKKQIFQDTPRKKAEILDISPPTLQKTNRTKYPLRNFWSNHTLQKNWSMGGGVWILNGMAVKHVKLKYFVVNVLLIAFIKTECFLKPRVDLWSPGVLVYKRCLIAKVWHLYQAGELYVRRAEDHGIGVCLVHWHEFCPRSFINIQFAVFTRFCLVLQYTNH